MTELNGDQHVEPCDKREEAKLIKRAQRRDADALRRLIDLHKDRLAAFVWRMIRNQHDAEEICQETFLKAFTALDTFDPSYRFSTWLFTIAYRLTLNSLRKKKPVLADIDFAVFAGESEGAEERCAATEEAENLKRTVWETVEQLSPPQRAAVLLFYRQQQGCNEIAEILEIPVATVKSHLHRARAKLKKLLTARLSEESDSDRILGELAG